ncbi:MAG: CoA transferase [Acidimicrobiales bacterium]|nr:CoA transferase [Acidimicrobiales bacterium]
MFTDLRVLDLSSGIAGPYATKLLADAGADVVKVEGATGDPLRRWSATGADLGDEDGALFRYLNTSKRSVVGALDDPTVSALVRGADVLIEDDTPGVVDVDALHAANPALVVVSISPFGADGPWAHRPATEFTLQAWCGSIASRGTPDRPPVAAGGRIGEWVAGAYAAVAGAAAWRLARDTGRGEHVDISMFEAMSVTMNTFTTLFFEFTGSPPPDAPTPTIELPSIEPTSDGFVGFCTIARQQFEDFLVLIDHAELLADDALANATLRARRMDEFLGYVRPWTAQHTTDEIIERASALRIPVAPVLDGATVVGHEQFVSRGSFVEGPHGFTQPRIPYRIGDLAPPAFRPAPALGEHTGAVTWPVRPPAGAPEAQPETEGGGERVRNPDAVASTSGPVAAPHAPLPLDGVRIVDFTAFWAGPSATQLLAALGADVVKVESIQRPDGMRFTSAKPASVDQWWEWGFVFHGANANKRSVTLDLNRPEGLELVLRLIADADVVVENFSPRVMENFGLAWETVHAAAPRAVMLRMPAFGLDGPWRDRTGFAQTMEQLTGMAAVTGYPDGPPVLPRGAVDPLAGQHAVFALLAALDERDRTGTGMLVEATLAEAALNIAAEPVVEQSAYGRLLGRHGNQSPMADPQGVYPCAEGQWLAVAAATDAHREALADLLAATDVQGEPGNEALAFWCAERPVEDAVTALLSAGVPAAVLVHPAAIDTTEQHQARAFFEVLDHPVTGRHGLPSLPFRYRRHEADHVAGPSRGWLRTPPPTLGQHTDEVLRTRLGLGDDELARLRAEGITGDRPAGL